MNEPVPPLVPAEVDLRDFAFMPLDVVRLRDSGLTAKASGDEFRAAVLLWCASWHQVPAASLPDDDDELANICGYSRARREWVKVRDGAMRGWKRCADGRLYHQAVAGKALEAWIEKLASAIGGASGNAKRWGVQIDTEAMRDQFRRAAECLRWIDPQSRTLRKKAVAVLTMPSAPESGGDIPPESPPESPPDRKGQGQGQGQGQGLEKTGYYTGPSAGAGAGAPSLDGFEPTAAGTVCLALRTAGIARTNPGNLRLTSLLEAGATAAEFLAYVDKAKDADDPFAYVLGCVEGERKRAKASSAALHRGRLPTKQEGIEQRNRAVADEWLAQQGGA